MTKKDYQVIARAIYRVRTQDTDHGSEARGALSLLTEELSDLLADDNPNFQRETFILACEDGNAKRVRS
jgi:hypothetical protein